MKWLGNSQNKGNKKHGTFITYRSLKRYVINSYEMKM